MPELTRRRLLGSAAAVAAVAGFEILPRSVRRVLAAGPPDQGSLDQVEHVVILIQENRSFDHYFGSLSGVRGFDDPTAMTLSTGRSVFYQPDGLNPDGYELPFHLDMTTTSAAAIHDLSHAWTAQHKSWNGGRMDNWLPAHRAADGNRYGPLCMGYHTREDIPFHYALADAFTICDNYHCGVYGPTWPNRLIAMTGTIDPDGTGGGPCVENVLPPQGYFSWTTYAEQLQAAGVDWRSYQQTTGQSELSWFHNFKTAAKTSDLYLRGLQPRPVTAFMDDVLRGDVAQVTWLHSNASEHPSGHPADGAQYMYDVLDALARRPDIWAKTVLFITYDENDGFFDHVPPPAAPTGTPGEYITVSPLPSAAGGITGPVGPGFRVPMIVVSPWSVGGWVCSEVFDHSSTLRFVERRFGVKATNISAWRRSVTGDLTSALRFPQPDVPFPRLPDPGPQVILEDQEAATLPAPTVPAVQTMPVQEPGGNRLVDLAVGVRSQVLSLGQQTTVTAVISNAVRVPQPEVAASGQGSALLKVRPAAPAVITGIAFDLNAPQGWSVDAKSPTTFASLEPGSQVAATWALTPRTAAAASVLPTVAATYQVGPDHTGIEDPVIVTVPIPFPAALNNVGISDDSAHTGSFDGSGHTYSEQALTGAGLAPGAGVTFGGVKYTWPSAGAGTADNVRVTGQTIAVPTLAGATRLAFLGAASSGDATGALTIRYTDGTTQAASIGFSDWTLRAGAETAQYGNAVAATTPYRNSSGTATENTNTYVFATVPIVLTAGKTIASVGLPREVSGGKMHVFAIGTDLGPLT